MYNIHRSCGLCCKGVGRQNRQLNTYDWLADIPGNDTETEYVEVQFKNTRKGYYRNVNHLPLEKGDVVAVEASPGHDIGEVTLTGRLVKLQMRKANIRSEEDLKRIYRKAKPVDMDKFNEAKAREHDTMIESRQIAQRLGLQMKIGDVEYQGDGNKAIFYYIADERVDFRQLIKVLAEAFHVRIEMKQIGARQEAGRIGGIGPCGRELCCATWMTSFVSVSTNAARLQDISLNPQKLAGQCAKLKCCLNYEVDCYVEAQKKLPSREITLETKDATYYFNKADILANAITYSTDKSQLVNEVTISGRRAFEIINLNRHGQKPDSLQDDPSKVEHGPVDLVEQESLTRFDRARKSRNKKGKGGKQNAAAQNRPDRQQNQAQGGAEPQAAGNGQPNGDGARQGRNNNRRNRNKGNNNNRRPDDGNRQTAAGNTVDGNAQQQSGQQPRRKDRPQGRDQRQQNDRRDRRPADSPKPTAAAGESAPPAENSPKSNQSDNKPSSDGAAQE